MAAPVAITDALESVLDIFFSSVRHRERAAFILCDNLVEMACKTKAQQHNHNFDTHCGFHTALGAPGVSIDQNTGLGRRLKDYRETRNNMQHGSAAATVDTTHCANAILDSAELLQRLWPYVPAIPATPTSEAIPDDPTFRARTFTVLRLVRLYAITDDFTQQEAFEDAILSFGWRVQENEAVRANFVQIHPGRRENWLWALRYRLPNVERMLDEIGAP